MANRFTFEMSEAQATNIFALVESHNKALKNWMATAVESGDMEKAQKLVNELRQHEALFAAFNIEAKYLIANLTGKPIETVITVANNR